MHSQYIISNSIIIPENPFSTLSHNLTPWTFKDSNQYQAQQYMTKARMIRIQQGNRHC